MKLDTEDYRRRRKETLENLARGIAYKVKKTRKPVVLEPMNPYERRIIHSALQGNKFVETVSEGDCLLYTSIYLQFHLMITDLNYDWFFISFSYKKSCSVNTFLLYTSRCV